MKKNKTTSVERSLCSVKHLRLVMAKRKSSPSRRHVPPAFHIKTKTSYTQLTLRILSHLLSVGWFFKSS